MLLKRGNIYYFRWQIPSDLRPILGGREIVKSLKTTNIFVARERSLKINLLVSRVKRIRALRKSREEWLDEHLKAFDDLYPLILKAVYEGAKAEISEMEFSSYEELLEYKSNLAITNDLLNSLLQTTELKVRKDGVPLGETLKIDAKEGSPYLDENTKDFLSIIVDALAPVPDRYNKVIADFMKIVNKVVYDKYQELDIAEPALPNELAFLFSTEKEGEDRPLLFSEFHSQFVEHKKRFSSLKDKSVKNYERLLRDWLDLVGDKPVGEVSKKDIKGFCSSIGLLPKRTLKEYRGKLASELIELEFPEEHRVAPKAVKEALKWLQGVFVFAVDQDLTEASPARDVKLGVGDSLPYSDYKDQEVRLLLERSEAERVDRRWVIWLAAYSGMRLGEILQLTKDDIKHDSSLQRDYIHVNDSQGKSVKTRAAIRQIPIHAKLIASDFLKYVAESDSKLFPDFQKDSKYFSQWYKGFREAVGITALNDLGQRKVFHSFRHTIITKARGKGVPLSNIQQIVGHEKTSAGVTDRYTHGAPLKDVLQVIDCLDYNDC